jgi:hypothetical protein
LRQAGEVQNSKTVFKLNFSNSIGFCASKSRPNEKLETVVSNGSDKVKTSIQMTLDDNIWKELKGGYKIIYDASVPLRQLEKTTDKKEIEKILDELWNELHHQGDVGEASYLAVPQLVRIAKNKGLFDWKLYGLCAVIEQQRHLGKNPSIPIQFIDYYTNGLIELNQFVISNLNMRYDDSDLRVILSTIATCKGQVKLGKAIIEMSDDVLDEFLEQY